MATFKIIKRSLFFYRYCNKELNNFIIIIIKFINFIYRMLLYYKILIFKFINIKEI